MSQISGVAGGPAILVEGLTKSFGEVKALRGIDLSVPRGTVLGVLGPTAAGKTTAVRILTTLMRPDGGRAMVEGYDVVRDAAAVRRSIGLAGQSAAIQEELTGRENLEISGRLYHLSWPRARGRAAELLEQFDLADAADRSAKNYSGGMQRRLDLAASLVGQPKVLFLDEPTSGLDPRSRLGMWEIIRSLVADGRRIGDAAAAIARIMEGAGEAGGEPHVDQETGVVGVGVGGRGSEALIEAVRALGAAGIETPERALGRPALDDVSLAWTGPAAEDEEPRGRRRGPRGRHRSGKEMERTPS